MKKILFLGIIALSSSSLYAKSAVVKKSNVTAASCNIVVVYTDEKGDQQTVSTTLENVANPENCKKYAEDLAKTLQE